MPSPFLGAEDTNKADTSSVVGTQMQGAAGYTTGWVSFLEVTSELTELCNRMNKNASRGPLTTIHPPSHQGLWLP